MTASEATWLAELAARVPLPDRAAARAAAARLRQLTKPPGSLGRLEALAVRIAAVTGRGRPDLRRKVVLVMAADHGVAREGVSAYPAEVTSQMVRSFLRGGAAVNVLARRAGARVVVVDMGVAAELPPHPDLIPARVAPGTASFVRGPAMTREQALAAVRAGARAVARLRAGGLDVLALGEMGIGNTTAAAAVTAALTGADPERVVGRGTGIDDPTLRRKQEVVRRALALHRPDPADPLGVLAAVGGFELAGMAGAVLAAAAERVPVILDGFITTAAALAAARLAPRVTTSLIAAHRSREPGHALQLRALGLRPLLSLGLRLGEASGACLALLLADAACRLLEEMATFAEAGVAAALDPARPDPAGAPAPGRGDGR